MKNSKNFRFISVVLSLLLIFQIIPFSALAVESEMSTTPSESEPITEEVPDIICEDISKRTEYTKDFLLEDGSYYKISTSYSLHSLVNEEWIDNYNVFLNVNTINEVKQAVNLLNSESSTANNSIQTASETSESVSNITITPIYNADICWTTEYEAYEIASPDGAVQIIANSIEPYINKNKVINSAHLNFTRDSIDRLVDIETTFYEGVADVSSETINELRMVDKITVSEIEEYSIDITNLFSKWDIGITENYGIILRAQGNNYLTIKNIFFEIYYNEIDVKDANYTYRTIDMDNAGVFQINDYTNTTFYEQKLFNLNSRVLPICVSRINNGVNPSVSNSAGFGFTWNIESKISVCGNIGTWMTIDCEKKIFVPEENVTIEEGYQVWKEVGTNEIVDNLSVYFYVLKSEIESGLINYSNVFIVQGETKYCFDNLGRLIKVEKLGSNNNILSVSFVYDTDGNLDYILDETNTKYDFIYKTATDLRCLYLNEIKMGNSDDYITFNTSQRYSNAIINSDYVENNVTFSNGTSVSLDFDKMGNIIHITDVAENAWRFNYVNHDDREKDSGNRITSFARLFFMGYEENGVMHYRNKWMLKFSCLNGYFREIIRTTDFATDEQVDTIEIIQYDKNHRVITHKDYDGQCICVEYDENGVVNSYAFNESENNLIANASFQIEQEANGYAWSTNENAEIVTTSWEDTEHGSQELKMSLSEETDCTVSQTVTGEFLADNTYVVGAWVKVDGTMPTESHKIGVEVKTSDETSITFATFDNGLDGEWQYRLQAFKLSSDCNFLTVNLTALNQIGEIRFDEITLFEAVESQTDLLDIVTTSPISYSYNNDGTISSETMTDGINSMIKSYIYDENGNVIEVKDINGLTEYYKYDSLIKWIGTVKNSDGDIEDATQLIYDSYGVLQTVNKTIHSVVSGEDETLTTIYGTENGEITSVCHNGLEYLFEYNSDGTLASIDVSPKEDSNEPLLIEYGYNGDSSIGYIVYKNGYEIDYTYNAKGNITLVECFYVDFETGETTPIKSYEYTYNNNKLISSYDTETGYTIVYSDNGYSIETSRGDIDTIELYSNEKNENGVTLETFRQAHYTSTNNTNSDIVSTSPTSTSADSTTGNTENSSTIVVDKNNNLNGISTMSIDRSSLTDYFNRVINKNTVIDYDKDETISYDVVSNTNYEYRRLDVGVTSGLVSSYSNQIFSDMGVSSETLSECATYSRYFEYDHKGNIKFAYSQNGTVVTPMEYYEYDEANQLVLSIDFSKNEVVTYQYNSGGNISGKIYYDFATTQFDYENREVVALGSIVKRNIFSYDTVFKDQLVQITTLEGTDLENEENTTNDNSFNISYDELGNPLNYLGYDSEGETVTGILKWNGSLLSSFENDTLRIEYEYDANGYRTQKRVLRKNEDSFSWEHTYTMSYIWNNGELSSLLYLGNDGEETNINIIYDQEGNPTGFVSAQGVPYFYLKDVNENIIALVSAEGNTLASVSYDNWGKPEFTFIASEDSNILTESEKSIVLLNPATYHGYIYDYEIGMYCSNDRCYSPVIGRYLNPGNPLALKDYSEDVLDVNLYLFCNNNAVNNIDPYATWSRDYIKPGWNARGFNVEMNELFASRSFCTVFANQFLKKYGEWNAAAGYTCWGMDSLRIASDLFAHYVGKNASSAINKINALWGDGWLLNSGKTNTITIKSDDENAWKYEKIWYAASELKPYAWSQGVYITL